MIYLLLSGVMPSSTVREPRHRTPTFSDGRRAFPRQAVGALVAVTALFATLALAPTAQAQQLPESVVNVTGQSLTVAADAAQPTIARVDPSASPDLQALRDSGTNADWATLVLIYGQFPVTEANVTVFLQWMRQENGTDNWWNRNNPMNNSLGLSISGGLGTYANLDVAAQKAGENLRRSIFADIAKQLDTGRDTGKIAYAIWWSRWSTSHYANGTHWSTAPVPIVKAPSSAWR